MKKNFTLLTICFILSGTSFLAAQTYEAESAVLSLGAGSILPVVYADANASGGQYVDAKTGDITFTITIPTDGDYTIYSSSRCGSTKDNYFQIDADERFNLTYAAATSYTKRLIKVHTFTAGDHTVKFIANWGYLLLDNIQVENGTSNGLFDNTLITNSIVKVNGQLITVQPQTSNKYQLRINDVSGKLIFTQSNLFGEISFKLPNLKGVYLMSIGKDTGNEVHKIVVN